MRQLALFLVLAGLFVYYWQFEFGRRRAAYGDVKTFDGTGYFWPKSVPEMLKKLAPHHKMYVEQEQTVDMVFPMIYGAMFAFAISTLAPGARLPWQLALIPVFAAAFDYVENLTAIALMHGDPDRPGALAYVISVASAVKTTLFLGSALVAVAVAVVWVVRR